MKKAIVLFIAVFCCSLAFSQSCTINLNDTISVSKKGMEIRFTQNDCKLKPGLLMKELGTIEACAAEIKLAKKHRTNAAIMIVCGVITFPIGYLILIVPMINQFKKSDAHIKAAVDIYNARLKAVGACDDGTIIYMVTG